MRSTVEPPGANCATGGVKLEFGRDLDRDGVLETSEIYSIQTRFVCNGTQGPAGSAGMQGAPGDSVVSTPLSIGDLHCPFGGVQFAIGMVTTYACTGVPGTDGTQGAAGPQGPQGVQGNKGDTGAQGPQGIQGDKGDTGAQGPQGPAGTNGQSVAVETVPAGDPNCPAGGSKFTAANGIGFACNGVGPNTVLNAGAVPLASCASIFAAGGSPGSGVYKVDPDGGSPSNAFLVYCDMTTSGGGWTLVMNVNPTDGNRVGFTNTTFWQTNAEYGDFTNHFTNDYKSPAAFTLAGTNVMVQVAQPGASGGVIGWKAWSMPLKTFDTFFDSAPETIQTTAEIGSDVAAVYAWEPLIKGNNVPPGTTQLISNRSINLNNDRVRLGAGGYNTSDNNEPGLGTQMNEASCAVGTNCWRYRDVELRVSNTGSTTWCNVPTGDGQFKWVGTDGGCGSMCFDTSFCFGDFGQYLTQTWTYRIYVR